MDWDAALPWIVALGGGTGIGAGITALINTIRAIRSGVSAREGKRRADIVQQRDEALLEADRQRERAQSFERRGDDAIARADWAEQNAVIAKRNEQRAREHAAELRLLLMEEQRALRRDELPKWPKMEDTVPRSELIRMLANEQETL